jgi:glutathione synthase/RimK-type ligase-like ATP-grasp enzyme
MRVLIPTQLQDIHAIVVQRALASRGHDVTLSFGVDLPQRATLSVLLEGARAPQLLDGFGEGRPFDTVWLRRPSYPVLPSDLDPDDVVFATREWKHCLDSTWNAIEPAAFWVNPRIAMRRASCKLTQLSEAARIGMSVPRTLVSSDPARIRAFVSSHEGETIYKPFGQASWALPDGSGALLFATALDASTLPDDDVLRLTPGLFQARLDKAYELRVNVMGQHVFASRIDSQKIDAARVDWRAGNGLVDVAPIVLPTAVMEQCRRLLQRLGLVFGCLDLVVTPRGEHVFLEINPMGQFLWLEEMNPAHRLLDAFCSMLVQARPDFAWDERRAELRWADFYDGTHDAIPEGPELTMS